MILVSQSRSIPTNKLQTQLDDKQWEALDKDTRAELVDFIESIGFIRNLISQDRVKAKYLERWDRPYSSKREPDPEGKIAVDITNPHILEDMNFFREPALEFQKTGKYTSLYPNKHPNSEYYKFWKEEARRCREGLVRPSDGEWIPGDYYFYLNYSPIFLTEINEEDSEDLQADRVFDFP